MNIFDSKLLKITTLALSVFLTSCGEGSESNDTNKVTKEKLPAGQVVARVNGEEITVYELNNELSRVRVTDENREAMSRNILKSLVVRTIFEQNAIKNKLDRTPNIMMEVERSKSTILAKAYLQSQMVKKPDVPRSEVDAYIFDNPDKFANRAYYTFDTIILPNEYLSKDRRESWEKVTNLDEIESTLLQEGIEYKRMPYTAFSETLPAGVLKDMPDLKINGDVFFIVMKDVSYLNIYKTSRPAVLTGEKAFMVAEKYLSNQKTKEFLTKLEADVLDTADIQYLGDYESLSGTAKTPVDPEVKEELEKAVSVPDEAEAK